MNNQKDGEVNQRPTPTTADKRSYTKPRLTEYGDVRDLTLAPSPGTFESGQGSGFRDPGEKQRRSKDRGESRDSR